MRAGGPAGHQSLPDFKLAGRRAPTGCRVAGRSFGAGIFEVFWWGASGSRRSSASVGLRRRLDRGRRFRAWRVSRPVAERGFAGVAVARFKCRLPVQVTSRSRRRSLGGRSSRRSKFTGMRRVRRLQRQHRQNIVDVEKSEDRSQEPEVLIHRAAPRPPCRPALARAFWLPTSSTPDFLRPRQGPLVRAKSRTSLDQFHRSWRPMATAAR